jgi:hypothetical protein
MSAGQSSVQFGGDFIINTSGVPNAVAVKGAGNVGIGTTTPTSKLEVAGTISAQSLMAGPVNTNSLYVGRSSLGLAGLSVGNPVTSALRLTNAGNLVNIGSYQGGSMTLTKGGTFGTNNDYSTDSNPYSVFSADFNGDGKMDLATTHINPTNKVAILLGTSTGTFYKVASYTVGTNPYSVFSADFNGDGKMDLATANQSSGSISVLLGTGTGGFSSAVPYTVG